MNLSFNNAFLRSHSWEGRALFHTGNSEFISGTLYLSATSFVFKRPTDQQGWPILSGKLSADQNAVVLKSDVVTLKAQKDSYRFLLFSPGDKSLLDWVSKRTEAFSVMVRSSNSILEDYSAYPHPFVEAHISGEERKTELIQYLGECIPILKQPIDWGVGKKSIHIDDEKTEFVIDAWKYKETKDQIVIDAHICEFGFFDDSGYEMTFHYEISGIESCSENEYPVQVENNKANKRFLAEKHAHPSINGKEDFIAENPFGLKGNYRIRWLLQYD